MSASYRAVVIGCGRIGSSLTADAREPGIHSHAQAYREHPRTELAGLSDTDEDRLAKAVRDWGVPGDVEAVALCRRMRPDIVSVCTPDATHAEIAREIIAAAPPRLLFIEKPIAGTVAEAEAVADAARRAGVAIAVDHTRRYIPAFRVIGDELRQGIHGRPLLARGIYGKGLRHNGVHAIDILRLWLGEPTQVRGRPAVWGPDDDPTFDLALEFGDARAYLDAFDERVATVFEMELLTEHARIRFRDGGDRWDFAEVGASARYDGYRVYVPTDRGQRDPLFQRPLAFALRHAIDDLVHWLDGKGALACDASEATAALRVIERVHVA